jgi:hypothetical protein
VLTDCSNIDIFDIPGAACIALMTKRIKITTKWNPPANIGIIWTKTSDRNALSLERLALNINVIACDVVFMLFDLLFSCWRLDVLRKPLWGGDHNDCLNFVLTKVQYDEMITNNNLKYLKFN